MRWPYLLFLGDVGDQLAAKTAKGVADWRPDWCLGQYRLEGCKADLGLPEMDPGAAIAGGAETLVIGVANSGGFLAPHWIEPVVGAIEAGMDVASGLHIRLGDVPEIADAAARHGRQLFDLRIPTQRFRTGTGLKRTGLRLLAVGTDCSCGKMYTTLALEQELRRRGRAADFRATGQTGILIAGEGVAIDAVIADFIAGAVEWLSPDADPAHWDLIEGQGSLFHPAFAGVSLGLLHGAQPDALVLCHEPTRRHMRGLAHQPLPELATCLAANLEAARLTNPAVRCVGASINSSLLPAGERRDYLAAVEALLGVPTVDPMIDGVGRIADGLW